MKTLFALLASLMITAAAQAESPPPLPSWTIDPAQSALTFEGTQQGAAFKGSFGVFGGTIIFDENQPALSQATITIDMNSASTGSKDRDAALPGAAWFDSARFPQATYKISSFEKKDDGSYVGRGSLTIRDQTHPLDLPFTLAITIDDTGKRTAKAEGRAEIKRLDYGVGSGEWADESAVGGGVTVAVSLTATTP